MIDLGEMRGSAGVVGLGRGLYVTSLFILNIGLARCLGTESFGAFQQVFMFSAFFMILTMGIPETLYFFLPRISDEEKKSLLGQTLVILFAIGILSAALIWIFAPFLSGMQKTPEIMRNLRLFGVYGAFLVASSFADPVFIYFKRTKYLFLLSAVHGVFFIILTFWEYFSKADVYYLFLSMSIFGVFKYAAALAFLFKTSPGKEPVKFSLGRKMFFLQLGFSLPIALSNSIDIISKWMDKYVVSFIFGPGSLGIFTVGAIEIPFISVIVSSIYNVVTPALSTYYKNNEIDRFVKLNEGTLMVTSKIIWPMAAYLFIFADHIVPLIFKSTYAGAVEPFRIYLLMIPLRITSFGSVLIALGKPRYVLLTALAAMIMNAVLSIVLAYKVGFVGPAIATVISTYFHAIVLYYLIVKTLKTGFLAMLPLRFFLQISYSIIIAAAVAYLMTIYYPKDIHTVVISFFAFGITYMVCSKKLKVFRYPGVSEILGGILNVQKNRDRKD